MANIKTTWFLELTTVQKNPTFNLPRREAGWSESLVSTAGSVTDQQLVTNGLRYANKRTYLLANQGRITGMRFHNLDDNSTRAYPFTGGSIDGGAGDCSMPQLALLTRFWGQTGTNNRPGELRGLPAGAVTTGEYTPGFFPNVQLNQWVDSVVSYYGMLGVNKANPHFKVDGISASGVVSLKEDQVGIAIGNYVQFYRTKFDDSCCGSVGIYKVTAAAARTLTLDGWDSTKSASGGKVGKYDKPSFIPFDASKAANGSWNGFGIERASVVKVGRPFDLFSGRRSRKCCVC